MARTRLDYTLSEVKNMNEREQRRIYSKMRDIAHKRQARLTKAGYGDVSAMKFRLTPLKDIEKGKNLTADIMAMQGYLNDPRSRLSVTKEYVGSRIDKLHASGYTNINRNNFADFANFMNAMREKSNGKLKDSDTIAQIYDIAEAKRLNRIALQEAMDRYDYDQQNLRDLRNALEKYKPKKERSASAIMSKVSKVWKGVERIDI